MFPQFVQYLIHLKCCQDSLNEHCSSDGAAWNTQFILSQYKDIIPETGLQVILQFGQVEVGASACLQQRFNVVEEVQAKIEDPAGNRLPVNEHVLLLEMPASRTHEQGCRFLEQRVLLAFGASIA